jgi:hypothetical protein
MLANPPQSAFDRDARDKGDWTASNPVNPLHPCSKFPLLEAGNLQQTNQLNRKKKICNSDRDDQAMRRRETASKKNVRRF